MDVHNILAIIALLTFLEVAEIGRWKLNHDFLGRSKTPENPIKLSAIYQADFFKEKISWPPQRGYRNIRDRAKSGL